jgi:hypothetical protein
MTLLTVALGTIVVLTVVILLVRARLRVFLDARGDRVVACPDNGDVAAVRVDAAHAALTPASGDGHFRLESCSRWPEKAGCGQECLRQIETGPTDCLVRTQVAEWYADKACAICGAPLGRHDWPMKRPALRRPDGVTVAWQDVRPESLPSVLASCDPVCRDCHVAETFRRTHPALAVGHPPVK